MPRRALLAIALAVLATLVAVSSARGDNTLYIVTGTADGGGACAPYSGLPGSFTCPTLRSAVAAADASPGSDVVVLQSPGTYALTLGALVPAGDVTIFGQNANTTTLRGNGSDRVLAVNAGLEVTLSGVTVAGGVSAGEGGDILNGGDLSLAFVRVTDGHGAGGGGVSNSGSLDVLNSLVDNNQATSGRGGGILNHSSLGLLNTTVFANDAPTGGGISSTAGTVTLSHATVGFNTSGSTPTGIDSSGSWTSVGSLFASNIGDSAVPSNCSNAPSAGSSGNIADDGSCNFAGSPSANIQLSPVLSDQGGQTGVLTIPANSSAKGFVSPCDISDDQRDAPRNASGACDAGAFEQGATAPPVTGFTIPQPPAPTPTPVVTPTPTPVPTATPVAQQSVAGKVVDGTIKVKKPGGKGFVNLDPTQPIPLGSTIDATHGDVQITSQQTRNGKPQTAIFFDGQFKITQTKATTDLTLNQALATCGKSARASAAKKPKTRKLWGNGSGSFRTRGQYSSATVRGTEWLVQDSCGKTLTRVKRGVVSVRDEVKNKTVVVRAPHSYTARPKR